MNSIDNINQYAFYIQTVQASAIRILIEALKEILTEANFEFDKTGIKIITMDSSHTMLVHLKLNSENFESFYCPEKVIVGIGLMNLYKLIKTLNNNSILTLFLENNDSNRLGVQIQNTEKNTNTVYKLNIMDLMDNVMKFPPAEFSSVITMASSDFQKICRDMYNLSDIIEIKSVGNKLILSCRGDFAEQETVISSSFEEDKDESKKNKSSKNMKVTIENTSTDIIQGIYSLKFLVLFTKCTNLSNSIELYMKNDFPLILKYTCASLGNIKLVLAPHIN